MSKLYDYSKENLEKIVKESWCQSDAMLKLSGKWKTSETLMKYIKLYSLDISHWKKQLPLLERDDKIIPKTKLQNDILYLRSLGKTYSEIALELNCSKSSVSYILRNKTKDKTKLRKQKYEEWELKFIRRTNFFHNRKITNWIRPCLKDWKMKLRSSTNKFIKRNGYMSWFGYKDVLKKYDNKLVIQCYLTGDTINLTKDDYAFDHIIPISRGGSCDLDNLGITTYIANQAKSNMTEDEFVDLCKKVLIHHGYTVEKND